MATEFTDLSSIATTPLKANDKQMKKRGVMSGRLRLLPIGDSPASNYDMPMSNNNNSSNNNSNNNSGSSSTLLTSHKLKKITQKRELAEAVRKANSPIVLPNRESALTSSLRSLHDSFPASSVPETDTGQKDIECLEDGVNLNARKFNEHKMMVERRQKELNALLDELRALQLETQELSRIQNQETPISKKNNKIKQDISECTASMEEQMHLRRQLEHMLRRLQTNQLRVDAHVLAMSKAVDESLHEADEVKLLCRQLEAGKARAVQFLQDVQLQIQVERKARARELGDHEVRARNSQKMEVWRLQRIQERAEIAAELRGDLSAEEEARLLRSIESRERANEALHVANLTQSQKAADYEEVLDQLKLATGATSLGEVAEKLFAQGTTTTSLEKEKAQAEVRLIAVRQEKEQALQALNELKASGIGGIELNREVYNTLENEIQQAKATLKVNKGAHERLDGVITGVRQGSFGLAQRLQAFDDVLDITDLENGSNLLSSSSGSAGIPVGVIGGSRGENADCLAIAELKLTKMLELVGQQNSSVNSFGGFGGSGGGGNGGGENEETYEDGSSRADLDDRNASWSPTMNSDPMLHRNNIRVRPGMPFSHQLQLNPRDDSLDSARSDLSSISESGSDHLMDVLVPSRDILKMSSSRHFSEVMRKKDLAEKQKMAAEKGISDEEMMSKLRKRNQLEADTRLSTSPTRQNGLLMSPNGKEDKSYAFVTQLNFNDL